MTRIIYVDSRWVHIRLSVMAIAATLFLASACTRDGALPSAPQARVHVPTAAIVGATTTNVPFTAVAINDAGQVAGTQQSRALLYTPGSGVQDLGTLGGATSEAYGLNELGQVVGMSTTALGVQHAFLWTPGHGMRDLGALPGGTMSIARGINDRGDVVGQSTMPRADPLDPRQPLVRAFRWTVDIGMEDLGSLGTLNSSVAYDINNVGRVVGRAYSVDRVISPPTDAEYFSRAFVWAPGQGMQDLGTPEGGFSVAYAMNDAGQAVGRVWLTTFSSPPYGQHVRAVLWAPGESMRELGALWAGPYNSVAYGINEAGQVVGDADLGIAFRGIPFQAFIWTPADGMEALRPTTGLGSARDINNRQQVVGDGRIATLELAPGNNPPVAITGGPYTGLEGSAVSLLLAAQDNNDVGFVYRVSFGDGTPEWVELWPPASHVYGDDGTFTLSLSVRDPKGAADAKSTAVTIANVAPTILSLTGPAAPIRLNDGSATAPIALEFRDPGGQRDIYAAEIACGDGRSLTPTNIPVVETYTGSTYIGGTGTYAGECIYTSAGVYTIRATVSDEDGGTSAPAFVRSVVVYDPAGGSIAGNGFYRVAGNGQGKAHFSFDAVFASPDAVMPNGSVRFRIQGANLTFESTDIEMLVVQGNRAQLWGTGTLDGTPARFRITAVDGRATGNGTASDAVRVELWNASGTTVIYDSQPGAAPEAPVMTLIDGGNIRVRGG